MVEKTGQHKGVKRKIGGCQWPGCIISVIFFLHSPVDMRMRLLRHTKHTIVYSLSLLPKTQHDLCSFLVDLCFHTVSTWFFCRLYPESWRFVDPELIAYSVFPFRIQWSAFLSMGCSRRVSVCRISCLGPLCFLPCMDTSEKSSRFFHSASFLPVLLHVLLPVNHPNWL